MFGTFFLFLLFMVVVIAAIAFSGYNNLQRQAQEIRESASNVQVAVSAKMNQINQLVDLVKNYEQGEQLVHLKVSQDSSAASLMQAYQQSGVVLSALQGAAERFPQLKSSEQYHRLGDAIQGCEAEIQNCRKRYNSMVKAYNTTCVTIPTVFVARALAFPQAPYLEFDHSGVKDVTSLSQFNTDSGERLQQLLSGAGSQLANATKALAHQAANVGQRLSQQVNQQVSQPQLVEDGEVVIADAVKYFYMIPGSVPKGPLALELIQGKIAAGELPDTLLVAAAGSEDWQPLVSFS